MITRLESGEPLVDLAATVRGEGRPKRPWLMVNMVSSVDGATVVEGGSTALSDDDDRSMFRAIRSVADRILVGAGTARAENYRPAPGLTVVSGSLNLDPHARMFSDPEMRPTIIGLQGADEQRQAQLLELADVVLLPEITASAILGVLPDDAVILCEGGPTLNGMMLLSVDEVNWTVSPMLVGGDSPRLAEGPPLTRELILDRVFRGDRSLFLRYLAASP